MRCRGGEILTPPPVIRSAEEPTEPTLLFIHFSCSTLIRPVERKRREREDAADSVRSRLFRALRALWSRRVFVPVDARGPGWERLVLAARSVGAGARAPLGGRV